MIMPNKTSQYNTAILNALREDIQDGDHSSLACIPNDAKGKAKLLVKDHGVLAGVEIAKKVFELIEQGEYKSAYDTIKNGEWGHPERRNTTAELFAKDGFPHKFINKHKTQFIGNFKTK